MPESFRFPPLARVAFFFDFDGTLVDLAATPDAVQVSPRLIGLLSALAERTDGALAIVSGRPLADIDQFLAPLRLPTAGSHGAERRDAFGKQWRLNAAEAPLAQMADELGAVARSHPGMLLERKVAGVALHFRNAPDCEAVARAAAERLIARYADAFVLQPGKMVFEIKPKGVDKGQAIAAFMGEAPFVSRIPIFAGDDLTDEKGFAVVNEAGGVSVKIGNGDSIATLRIASVPAFLEWLDARLAGE
ncbi:MAG: trehalose-phosphatase [Janthinobacterium lividum]